jgi:hypothetical protein
MTFQLEQRIGSDSMTCRIFGCDPRCAIGLAETVAESTTVDQRCSEQNAGPRVIGLRGDGRSQHCGGLVEARYGQ